MEAEFNAEPAFRTKRHFLLPDTFAGCSALLTKNCLSPFFLAQCLHLLSPWETGHEVCSPPRCLAAVTTQARVKSLQSCQDLVLRDNDGVLFLSGRRVLSLSDLYLPEERQIASPRNCAHQGQKMPTLWSRADWCHRAWFMLTSIWTRLERKSENVYASFMTSTRIWTGICPNRRDICRGPLKEDLPAGGGHACWRQGLVTL